MQVQLTSIFCSLGSLCNVSILFILLIFNDDVTAVGFYLRRSLSLARGSPSMQGRSRHDNRLDSRNRVDQQQRYYPQHQQRPRSINRCPANCDQCHHILGCIRCTSRYYLHVIGIYQVRMGYCVERCPDGFYGIRHRTVNFCKKCQQAHCSRCSSAKYCTECKRHKWRHNGVCVHRCPYGLFHNKKKRKCQHHVSCRVSSWSAWTPCVTKETKCEHSSTCVQQQNSSSKSSSSQHGDTHAKSSSTPTDNKCKLTCTTCVRRMKWKFKTRTIEREAMGTRCNKKLLRKRRCKKRETRDVQSICQTEQLKPGHFMLDYMNQRSTK